MSQRRKKKRRNNHIIHTLTYIHQAVLNVILKDSTKTVYATLQTELPFKDGYAEAVVSASVKPL